MSINDIRKLKKAGMQARLVPLENILSVKAVKDDTAAIQLKAPKLNLKAV